MKNLEKCYDCVHFYTEIGDDAVFLKCSRFGTILKVFFVDPKYVNKCDEFCKEFDF